MSILWISVSLILSVLVYVFYVPLFWIKDLTDVGFHGKKTAINRARKLRKVGDRVPPPFPNGWFAIAESSEIKTGTAKSINCLGENLVAFRSSESNEVFLLNAYCPHLGANLGEGGIIVGDCIECPFHQWKFSGTNGNCVGIPYSNGLANIEKSARLKKWISKECNGLIFIWYHAEGEEPWELPVVEKVQSGEWIFYGKNEFIVNSHIQDLPENGADVAHLDTVHGPSIANGADIRFTRSKWFEIIGHHIWNAKWSAEKDANQKHIATVDISHVMKMWKFEFVEMKVEVKQVGPGYVLLFAKSSFGPMVFIQTVTPLEPLVQKLSHYFYGPRHLSWLGKFSIVGESINVERDVQIWNHKQFVQNPLLPKEDKQIKFFRAWYSQFYSENSKSFGDAMSTLNCATEAIMTQVDISLKKIMEIFSRRLKLEFTPGKTRSYSRITDVFHKSPRKHKKTPQVDENFHFDDVYDYDYLIEEEIAETDPTE